ncbi:MAG: cobyrinate a,c-diamide synthase [Nitrospinae bacterium]|nr:cobyrinate a,c-diamide synthase [Nitrospinota bacterium]
MFTIPRVVISGPHRSAGKTTFTFGLLRALADRGRRVQPYKKGPDYIDPMWHTAAARRPCRNLDFHMMGEENILRSMVTWAADADLAVIEGNQGLFDGVDPEGSDSTAGLAKFIEAPVIFVVDASRMNRGIAALLKGFAHFDPDLTLAGIILNKVGGPRHEEKLVTAINRHVGVPILGIVPKLPDEVCVTERHLGLVPVDEDPRLLDNIARMGEVVERSVDLDQIEAIARTAGPLPAIAPCSLATGPSGVRIGVARDRAFTFYYPENIEALQSAGAELVPFSPLADDTLPPDLDGLYLGGGFPEVFMADLEANILLRNEIRDRAEAGLPIHAECGGMMYLTRAIRWDDRRAAMVGLIDAETVMTKRPMGLGYMKIEPTGACGWLSVKGGVNCHEFHHSRIEGLAGDTRFAWKVSRGIGIAGGMDGILYKNTLASYAHLHHCGIPTWAVDFVDLCRKTRGIRR